MYMNRYPIVGMIDTSGRHVDTKYCRSVVHLCVLCLLPSTCGRYHKIIRAVVSWWHARTNARTHARRYAWAGGRSALEVYRVEQVI